MTAGQGGRFPGLAGFMAEAKRLDQEGERRAKEDALILRPAATPQAFRHPEYTVLSEAPALGVALCNGPDPEEPGREGCEWMAGSTSDLLDRAALREQMTGHTRETGHAEFTRNMVDIVRVSTTTVEGV
ncbi:hypothetical protein ACWCYY_18455 [Kitasatospora sp. NPDC001664]